MIEPGDTAGAVPCPSCGHIISRVIDSRFNKDKGKKRRRQCEKCMFRFSTLEVLDLENDNNAISRMWLIRFGKLEKRVLSLEETGRGGQQEYFAKARALGEAGMGPGSPVAERAPDDGRGDAVRREDLEGR